MIKLTIITLIALCIIKINLIESFVPISNLEVFNCPLGQQFNGTHCVYINCPYGVLPIKPKCLDDNSVNAQDCYQFHESMTIRECQSVITTNTIQTQTTTNFDTAEIMEIIPAGASCLDGYEWTGTECMSSIFKEPQCPFNYQLINGECHTIDQGFCPPNTQRINGECVFYAETSVQCPYDYQWDGNECVHTVASCPPGYQLSSYGECQRFATGECPANTYLEQGKCILKEIRHIQCPSGYRLNGSECIHIVQANCEPGFTWFYDRCVHNSTQEPIYECPNGTLLNGTECIKIICSDGYFLENGRCVGQFICSPEHRPTENPTETNPLCPPTTGQPTEQPNKPLRPGGPPSEPSIIPGSGEEDIPTYPEYPTHRPDHEDDDDNNRTSTIRPDQPPCTITPPSQPPCNPSYQPCIPPEQTTNKPCPPCGPSTSQPCYPEISVTTPSPPTPPPPPRFQCPSGYILHSNGTCISICTSTQFPSGNGYCPSGFKRTSNGCCERLYCRYGYELRGNVCYPIVVKQPIIIPDINTNNRNESNENEYPPNQNPNPPKSKCTFDESTQTTICEFVHVYNNHNNITYPNNIVNINNNSINIYVTDDDTIDSIRIEDGNGNITTVTLSPSISTGDDDYNTNNNNNDSGNSTSVIDGENNEEDEKCCEIISPRQCQQKNDSTWECFHRKYHRCGSFCTESKIYLKPRRFHYRQPILVIPPPPSYYYRFYQAYQQINYDNFDCSGCIHGGYHCSMQCYQWDRCVQYEGCVYSDQHDFCEINGGAGCSEDDGCFE